MPEKQTIRRGSKWRRVTRKKSRERFPRKGTRVTIHDGREPIMYFRDDDPNLWLPRYYKQVRTDFLRDFEPVEEASDG